MISQEDDKPDYACRDCGSPITDEQVDEGEVMSCQISGDPGEGPEWDGYWCVKCTEKICAREHEEERDWWKS